jgi:hypothetical protein
MIIGAFKDLFGNQKWIGFTVSLAPGFSQVIHETEFKRKPFKTVSERRSPEHLAEARC